MTCCFIQLAIIKTWDTSTFLYLSMTIYCGYDRAWNEEPPCISRYYFLLEPFSHTHFRSLLYTIGFGLFPLNSAYLESLIFINVGTPK